MSRRSLEAIAVEGYRTGALTESHVRRLLGLDTRFEVHALLKEHHVPLQYTSADIEDDLRPTRTRHPSMIVVADSGPLHYLILLEHVELLRRLYGQVVVPEAVATELSNAGAPPNCL